MDYDEVGATCQEILDAVGAAVIADEAFLESVLTGILAGGHVLLEDVPGTGKTLTARTFASSLNLSFSRIQFTPDLLPSDITGSNVYNEETGEFEFAPGPVFSNIVLADEINRAPPKTQAALLEAMGEKQVTVDGETNDLPEPFFVLATQNPIEQEGTFGLPEAQRDRFMLKLTMGYPDYEGERRLIDRRADRRAQAPSVAPVVERDTLARLQEVPESVAVADDMRDYVIQLGRATREDSRVEVGVSPRGIQRLFEVSRAAAAIRGRGYVVPQDVHRVVHATFDHRIVLTTEASVRDVTAADVVDAVLDRVEVPRVREDPGNQGQSQGRGQGR